MDYTKILEMDNVTLEDCENGLKMRGRTAIISNGKLINFLDKNENEIDFWRANNDSFNWKNM